MAGSSIPVGFVTGFLGSGKTTLIQQALTHENLKNTAVIVNEFGKVGLDHLLVAKSSETVIELRNGCICCTIHQDLTLTLRDLFLKRVLEEVPPFDYVLVETSGLADPGPLLHSLTQTPALKGAYHPDVVVTCVDLIALGATVAAHRTAADQIAMADLVILTKGDIAGEREAASALAALDAINPLAERSACVKGRIDPSRLFRRGLYAPGHGNISRWLGEGRAEGNGHHHRHDHGADYVSHAFLLEEPVGLAGLSVFLNNLVNRGPGEVLRIKGLAGFREKGGQPGLVHAVQGKFHPIEWLQAWPSVERTGRLVIIGRDLDTGGMVERFDALCR